MSALLDFLVFFLLVHSFFCQLTHRPPAATVRLYYASRFSLRLRSFPISSRQGDLFCSVHPAEDSFSWREPRTSTTCGSAASGTDTSADLIVADLEQETPQDARLKTKKMKKLR